MIANNNQDLHENIIKLIESQSMLCNRYDNLCRIDKNAGNGCFSLVFTAIDKLSKKEEKVVLKFFHPFVNDQYRRDCFYRESDLLRDLKGKPNILPLIQERTDLQVILNHGELNIPLPLMFYSSKLARFSVEEYIYNEETDFLTNIIFFREICKSVQRIHNCNICHRDLKPGNFFVYGKKNVCLGDFGTARYFGENGGAIKSNYVAPPGDKRYTAPEMLCGLHFSDKHNCYADIYSLGIILFELFSKTNFSSNVFKASDINDLVVNFRNIPEANREFIFDSIINGFSKDRELPSIRLFNSDVPRVIVREIDLLYKSLAALDYRQRQVDFQRIFLRINICEKVIRNYKEVEKWRRKKNKRGNVC